LTISGPMLSASPLYGRQTPRIGTPPTPGADTFGPKVAALSRLTGTELLPWQQHVHDVGLEVGADGKWLHNVVAAVVARQNGKTDGILVRRILAGLFLLGDRNILHAAQDRAIVKETFEHVTVAIDSSPWLKREVKHIRVANGQEEIRLKDGSRYRILAPKQDSFRGWAQVGLIIFDEIREQRDDSLWSAAKYTQRVHDNPQIWVASNAGDADSIVLNAIRDRGRAAADDPGSDPGIAYFEWSATDGADVDDPQAWASANPSLGHLIDEARLVEELRSDEPDRFRTEALCQWVETSGRSAVPRKAWMDATADIPTLTPDPSRPVWMAVDIDPERERASLVAVTRIDGMLVAAQVATWQATEGAPVSAEVVATDILKWVELWHPRALGFDPYTSTGIADAVQHRVKVEKITGVRWYTACSQLWDTVASGDLVHGGDEDFTADVLAAGRRDIGDGIWTMSRRDSQRSIPAATALGRALHLAVSPQIVPAIA